MNKIDKTELSSQVQKLPALSSVVTELLTSIDQEDVDVDAIAKKIACDQALTVKTLRLANSSFYGMQHKISSISEAINILGFKNVRMMISTSAITVSFAPTQINHFSFTSFWQHSLGTAICAQEIAKRSPKQSAGNPEIAFIAGLIHDIGKLVLVTHYPKQYELALEYQIQHQCDPEFSEREILGMDHCEIGTAVLHHWKFPDEIQTAISEHYLNDDKSLHPLSGIVHLADIFSLALDFSRDEHVVIPKISAAVWEQMKLDEAACKTIFKNVQIKFEEMSQILVT